LEPHAFTMSWYDLRPHAHTHNSLYLHFTPSASTLANRVKTSYDRTDGTIQLEMERAKFNIKITYNSEFEYPEENEETNEYEEDEANPNQEGDEEAGAFHRLKVEVTTKNPEDQVVGFAAEGTINMSGNFLIDSVVPFDANGPTRTIPLSDMSEAAVEKFEIALEEIALDQETCDFLPLYARHLRVVDHRKSLETLADFFTAAKKL